MSLPQRGGWRVVPFGKGPALRDRLRFLLHSFPRQARGILKREINLNHHFSLISSLSSSSLILPKVFLRGSTEYFLRSLSVVFLL